MIKSIWKKPEENPKGFSFILEHHKAYDFDNHKIIDAYNIFETGGNPQNPFDENTIRWCHLDELLAQADKAERLQKAVDMAIGALEEYADEEKRKYGECYKKAQNALDKIKQLIKGEEDVVA